MCLYNSLPIPDPILYIPPIQYAYMEQTEVRMVTENTNDFVILLRVSTTKQGANGNGIEAQRRDIEIFLSNQKNPNIIKEFVEVQSGGACKTRPVLEEAIATAKRYKCPLLVQKVDRLTRDVETLGRITNDKNLQLKIASIPNADNFQIHLYGILGAQEKLFVSQRTKAAMAAAKARGVKFGNPKLIELNKTRQYKAKQYANKHSHLIKELRSQNKSLRQICDVLNLSGIKTRNGNNFNPVQVHRILKRAS